jgi:hypothetical protein
VSPAPAPGAILWDNLHISKTQHIVRGLIASILMFLFIFFWSVPVLFIVGLANIHSLAQVHYFSWLSDIIAAAPGLIGFVEGFLPSFILFIFNDLTIEIIRKCVELCGWHDKEKKERTVLQAHWAYQVFNLLLVSVIGGTSHSHTLHTHNARQPGSTYSFARP